MIGLGSISAALSCPVSLPEKRSAGSFREQRLVIEPMIGWAQVKAMLTLNFLVLAEELENVRSLFMEKEKELAIAVAKVENLTQQLDKQRKGWSQSSPSREKTHQELELERLRKELMVRIRDTAL